ncbi:MAG: hypothetical protein NTY87_04425 [Planctomycetia bacterium]|nr:hypothetical protein [Planctomycetia bacterium]
MAPQPPSIFIFTSVTQLLSPQHSIVRLIEHRRRIAAHASDTFNTCASPTARMGVKPIANESKILTAARPYL